MSTPKSIVRDRAVHFHMHSGATISVPVSEGFELAIQRNAFRNMIGFELNGIEENHSLPYIDVSRIEAISRSADVEHMREWGGE